MQCSGVGSETMACMSGSPLSGRVSWPGVRLPWCEERAASVVARLLIVAYALLKVNLGVVNGMFQRTRRTAASCSVLTTPLLTDGKGFRTPVRRRNAFIQKDRFKELDPFLFPADRWLCREPMEVE